MPDNLIQQGVELMLLGMGVVFAFLSILVVATSSMSRWVGRWETPQSPTRSGGPSDDVLRRVIAQAVARHRRVRAK